MMLSSRGDQSTPLRNGQIPLHLGYRGGTTRDSDGVDHPGRGTHVGSGVLEGAKPGMGQSRALSVRPDIPVLPVGSL